MFKHSIILVIFFTHIHTLPDVPNLIRQNGYPAESHSVTTEDGYITTLHRIPHGKNFTGIGIPVYVTHGLGFSSADYVNLGPEKSLGYILADSGYDVWLGNARGNSYSMKHVKLDAVKDEKKFYNFSWHEIGYYDLPAHIDYILNKTNRTKLHYVSFSQGGTAFFVLTSLRPEYNEKIKLATLMAPPGILQNERFVLNTITSFIKPIEMIENLYHIYSLPFLNDFKRNLMIEYCKIHTKSCFETLNNLVGYADPDQFDQSIFPVILRTTPSGFPFKSLYHFGQCIKSGELRQYDYGDSKNIEIYGSKKPPVYNLTKITAPTAFYYGKNDLFVKEKDMDTTAALIPNMVGQFVVKWDKWNHVDNIYGKDVVKLLYNDIIALMKKYY